MTKLSVYGGTGFVGGNFTRMYPNDTIVIPREQREPESDEILYFISTVDNYNVGSTWFCSWILYPNGYRRGSV